MFLLLVLGGPAFAQSADVPTAWRLLDYIAVDYGGAVNAGRVTNAAEYAEMTEFAASVAERLQSLPPTAARTSLLADGARLKALVAAKASSADVAQLTRAMASTLLKAYPIPLAPARAPDLTRGAALFKQ
ncbi:MAG: iron permease, partial [Alphaproteobacteria bacterium]